ncbi:MAG: winged helix-turn-helix transcriptional regulator [Theionarchaea archaeon]|nr:winged helix-turn-helix transcriptional regulator [Theionarchaea archaeon]MBU7036630.1 winged helix-turn-helix transcriptional regulator [Theionarchaea archaeon]
MSRLTEPQKADIRLSIYEQLVQDERISLTSISRKLGLARNTVTSHYNHMIDHEILFPPGLRLKMFQDLKEYVYFMQFDKPMRVFQELEGNPRVIFQCLTSGAFDLIVFTDSPMDFESHPSHKETVLEGFRGDYSFTHVTHTTYRDVFDEFKKNLQEEKLEPGFLSTDLPSRKIVWTDLEWRLFYDLKYNMRRTFTEIVKKHKISKWLFYQSYDRVKENCIVTVPYYPEGASMYADFYLLLKTDYEKGLSDFLLQLPCTGLTFKVENHLVAWVNILRSSSFTEFFGILHWMQDNGIAEDLKYVLPIYQNRREHPL